MEAAFHLTGHRWLAGQASFLSQLLGFASTSDGRTRNYQFAPFVFIAVGPEYHL